MTKAEYEQAMADSHGRGFGRDEINFRIALREKYIASLEKENEALKSQAIVWHEYPDEKPEKQGWYLTSRKGDIRRHFWVGGRLGFDTNPTDIPYVCPVQPTCWAYLPAPPKEEMMPNELMKEKLWEIEQLQARIEEMEKQVKWHLFDIDNVDTYPPRADMYLTLSIPERTEYMEIDDGETYDVLWFELYSEEYWHEHNVTHWAYLPEPPKEEK